MCGYTQKVPIIMWRNFMGKFEGLKMAKMTDWDRWWMRGDGWWMEREWGRKKVWMGGKRKGKGREILVKMGVIRGGMLVRTNAQKSSKNWQFIQNLPPLQNGKCFQLTPNNCDYMVNPTLSPYILSEYRDIKSIPAIPIWIQGIVATTGKALFLQLLVRVYYDFSFFWYQLLTFH